MLHFVQHDNLFTHNCHSERPVPSGAEGSEESGRGRGAIKMKGWNDMKKIIYLLTLFVFLPYSA